MKRFNSLLSLRLKPKNSKKEKLHALAELSKKGELSSFSGVFKLTPLTEKEKEGLRNILTKFQEYEGYEKDKDLSSLLKITSEIKAITSQAIILHGERIKKAQEILKNYKEGAFTSWLIEIYGNRQTPYNFLQYFELYSTLSSELKVKIESMPRQAVYTLASRNGSLEKKKDLIKTYKNETKEEFLSLIRKKFPIKIEDKRNINFANKSISSLIKVKELINHPGFSLSEKQKEKLIDILDEVYTTIKNS